MILKAKERGDGRQLGLYLLRTDTSEHVEVHELRGFISDDLPSALHEIDALSRGTRARNVVFSLSLNPPPKEKVPTEAFESAIDRVEQRLGLDGQPRAIVFHEKDGRRHAHAVWSRIDPDSMTAINLSHYKLKLREIGRELFLEHGWQMPRGFAWWQERDPLAMSREEWQQAARTKHDPKAIKAMFQDCWAISDSGPAFAQALKERGYELVRGERRGHVAVDWRGKVYSVSRYTGQRTKAVKARLGDPADEKSPWPPLEKARDEIAERMNAMLQRHADQAERNHKLRSAQLRFQYEHTVQRQRGEREDLRQSQEQRWNTEIAARTARISRGFRGLWDRLTGKHAVIKHQNERETLLAYQRDRREKDDLIFRHLEERQRLHERLREERAKHAADMHQLRRDAESYVQAPDAERFRNRMQERKPGRERDREV